MGIRCADGWIYKSDCGAESNTEKEKGEASDSFKRACVNWGIGRELYTAPFIFVKTGDVQINNGKTYDRFLVGKIRTENGKIVGLSIHNETLVWQDPIWQDLLFKMKNDATSQDGP